MGAMGQRKYVHTPKSLPLTSQKAVVSDKGIISFVLGPVTDSQINHNYGRLQFTEYDVFCFLFFKFPSLKWNSNSGFACDK